MKKNSKPTPVYDNFGNPIAEVHDQSIVTADGTVVAHVTPLAQGHRIEVRLPCVVLGFIDSDNGEVLRVSGFASLEEIQAGEVVGTIHEARVAFPNAPPYSWVWLTLIFIDRCVVELLSVERAVKSLGKLSENERADLSRVLAGVDSSVEIAPPKARPSVGVCVGHSRRQSPPARPSTASNYESMRSGSTRPSRSPKEGSSSPVGVTASSMTRRRRR